MLGERIDQDPDPVPQLLGLGDFGQLALPDLVDGGTVPGLDGARRSARDPKW